MRTLKKVLALSLVFAMAFTMMAGAAFKDQDKIDSSLTDDIQLLTALGVFQGDENGNFNPTDNVRRSEAAKMIYVLKNNGVDDGAVAFQGVSKYSDVPVGHWAEGYINYCTNLGYMGGWKEGNVQKFDPNGNVTGVELMKMLLCMIGYKADVQGYTGNGWQTNVLVDAATSGLSVEFTPSVYAATPRQWTARLMVNAIDAPYVSYNNGQVQFGSWNRPDRSYGQQYLGLETAVGVLDQTKTVDLDKNAANIAKGTKSDSTAVLVQSNDITGSVSGTVKYDVSADLLGQAVKVYYKEGKNTGVSSAEKIYSVLPTKSAVYNTTLGDVKVDTTKISFDGYASKDYKDQTLKVYTNFVENATDVTVNGKSDLTGIGFGTNDNSAVKLVDVDNDGFIDSVFVTKTTYAIVNSIDVAKTKLTLKAASGNIYLKDDGTTTNSSSGALVFNSSNAEDWKYLNLADGLAENDVVAITPNYTSGNVVFDIVKADSFTGTVNGYKVGDSYGSTYYHYAEVTVDGTSYKVGAINSSNETVMQGYKASTEDATQLKDADTFYTDGKYVIYATGSKSSTFTSNLAYLINYYAEGDWNNGKVKVLTADGVQTMTYVAESDLPSDASVVKLSSSPAKDTVYEYVMDGERVYLKKLSNAGKTKTGTANAVLTYDKANKQINIDDKKVLNSDDSIYFVKYTENAVKKYAAIKGSELTYNVNANTSNINVDGKQYAYSDASGMPVMVFGVLNFDDENLPNATSSTKYAVVTGTANIVGDVDNNNYKVSLPVAGDGVNELIFKISKSNAMATMSTLNGFRNKLVSYTLSDEYVSGNTLSQVNNATQAKDAWTAINVADFTDTTIYGTDKDSHNVFYTVNSDTKFIYVSKSSSTADVSVAEEGSMSEAAETTYKNAIVLGGLDDSTMVAKIVVVEVDGNDISGLVGNM